MGETGEDRNMNGIRALIFGGTSEGRELAEYAAAHQVPVLVSVVSEYGESLLEENTYVRVHKGALDSGQMEQLMRRESPELVIDATHPYARIVSEQVESLCGKLSMAYRRVVRETAAESADAAVDGVYRVPSAEAAAALLSKDRDPVLLTTGSKELEVFAEAEHLKGRIYARVLPDSKVLEKCGRLGITGAHLIAMQGPFSVEMNRALLHQTGAGWLVTKESGGRGGFDEKLRAARECGCRVIVMERPVQETGISLETAKKLLTEYRESLPEKTAETETKNVEEKASEEENARTGRIALIGMGMGGGNQLTLEALEILKQCDVVFGASRMLRDVEGWCGQARKEPVYQAERILAWLDEHPRYRNIAVVYSGDTGFYSGCGLLLEKLRCRKNWQVQVYPGISSVSSLSARMQAPWDNLFLASAHGRSCDVAELVRRHKRLFLLLGGTENLNTVCEKLCAAGYGDTVVTAGVRMGYPDEKLLSETAQELCRLAVDELTAVVLERAETEGQEKENAEVNHER